MQDCKTLLEENVNLKRIHEHTIKKHKYYKFKEGPCFYVITSGLDYTDNISRIKIGITGTKVSRPCSTCAHLTKHKNRSGNINSRLQTHRCLWPQLKVKFLVYFDDPVLLEDNIKRVYRTQINPTGHEIIENIPAEEIIESVMVFLQFIDKYETEPTYQIDNNIEIYNKTSELPIKISDKQAKNTRILSDRSDSI